LENLETNSIENWSLSTTSLRENPHEYPNKHHRQKLESLANIMVADSLGVSSFVIAELCPKPRKKT